MECTRVEELLHSFIDGDLDEGLERSLHEHCKNCPACSMHLEELRFVESSMKDLPEMDPPLEEIWSKLSVRLEGVDPNDSLIEEEEDEYSFWYGLYLGLRGHWRVWAPSLTIAIVLLGIMPIVLDHGYVISPAARDVEFLIEQSTDPLRLDMTEEYVEADSSEARWEMVDRAFSDARLDALTQDGFEDWKLGGEYTIPLGTEDSWEGTR